MTEHSTIHFDPNNRQLKCRGDLNLANLPSLQTMLAKISWPGSGEITIDGEAVTKMDSAGAWLILELQNSLEKTGLTIHLQHFSAESASLLDIVKKKLGEKTSLPAMTKPNFLATVGINTIAQLREFQTYLAFIGKLTFEALRIALKPAHWRWKSLAGALYSTGYQGLPIIALLSFLIGVVLTYQMGLQ